MPESVKSFVLRRLNTSGDLSESCLRRLIFTAISFSIALSFDGWRRFERFFSISWLFFSGISSSRDPFCLQSFQYRSHVSITLSITNQRMPKYSKFYTYMMEYSPIGCLLDKISLKTAIHFYASIFEPLKCSAYVPFCVR